MEKIVENLSPQGVPNSSPKKGRNREMDPSFQVREVTKSMIVLGDYKEKTGLVKRLETLRCMLTNCGVPTVCP